jgi:hypothetical protein
MRNKGRTDSNQTEIVKELRKIPSLTVAITSQLGKGYPDILIGWKGLNFLIELKDGSKVKSAQKLTPDEERFHSEWTGQIAVCNSLDEVLQELGILKRSVFDIGKKKNNKI